MNMLRLLFLHMGLCTYGGQWLFNRACFLTSTLRNLLYFVPLLNGLLLYHFCSFPQWSPLYHYCIYLLAEACALLYLITRSHDHTQYVFRMLTQAWYL
jgi:hypothetical protein